MLYPPELQGRGATCNRTGARCPPEGRRSNNLLCRSTGRNCELAVPRELWDEARFLELIAAAEAQEAAL